MTLSIGKGITIGKGISITQELPDIYKGLQVFYDAGNSMSYSGSGIEFNTTYTGPNLNTYSQYGVLDLAGLHGGSWNSGYLTCNGDPVGWTSQGVSSYWTLGASSQNYINSTYQTEGSTLTSPTYTIVAVVRPQDFTQGAIVGGDQNTFFFNPTGGLNDGPALMAGNSYVGPSVVDTTTAFETNTWYCVMVTYDAITETMKLYTNGVEVDSATGVGAIDHPTGLFWGTLEGQLYYTGDMAVCMAYDRVLLPVEISLLISEYLRRYVPPVATSSIVFDQPYYIGGPPPVWTVPEGVTSISVVAVGAGGSGTQDSYSAPGGDTVMLKANVVITAQTTLTAGSTNFLIIDSGVYPDIMNVTADGTWLVNSNNIPGAVPAFALVTQSDSTGFNQWTIVFDRYISTTDGDSFQFYQAVVAAEGGYEINDSYYSANPDLAPGWGPGPRAKPLVTDGPYGSGGVVDWTDSWPIGGAGAGGYGIAGLAWNINQAGEWYYNGDSYHTMSFTNDNLTINGLVDVSSSGVETSVVGTQTIPTGSKVMYSLNISQISGVPDSTGVGLSNYGQNLWDYIGTTGNNSVGYFDSGNVYVDGTIVQTYSSFNQDDIVDIAVDADVGLVWFRVSGGNWNGGGSANPATGIGGFDITPLLNQNLPISIAASPYYNTGTSTGDIISIAETSFYSVPAGFTFVPGVPGAGGNGGDGSSDYGPTAMSGTGGSSGGGGGRSFDSGAGGGGTGLYGRGSNGEPGTWVDVDIDDAGIALGGSGGSNNTVADGTGGQATPWNGGRGGWPGGAGASATGYYDGGNGGALAYKNNYEVTPGEQFAIIVGLGGQGQNNGGSGANGAIRIVWPGNARQFPDTNVGPDTVAVPTLDITAHTFGQPNGQITFDITSDGGGTVLETGVIYGLPGLDTYLNSTDVCDGSDIDCERKAIRASDNCSNPYTTGLTGSQTINFNANSFLNEGIQVRAYARNAAGVAYSATTLTWTPTICLAEGTLITLADGSTVAIESITMSDNLKVWDFDLGVSTSATPLWIKRKEVTTQYNLIKFSDDSELKTISQHRIFNKQAGKFTYPMTDDTPIGTITVKSDGSEVTVVSKKVVYESVNYYNVVTDGGYMNLYANDILTSLRWNNIYPITDMKYVKDSRTLRDRSEFTGIADRWIDGLRLQEHNTDIKQIKKYVQRLEDNEAKSIMPTLKLNWSK